MLGSSKERYALAVGLDPTLSTAEMIAATRDIMQRRIKPVPVAKAKAPVNEIVLRGDEIDLTQFPVPKFWPGDGGRYIGTGDITLTKNPDTGRINVGCYRQMLHGPRRVGLYCSPGKHGLIDREAWWARGKPCEVVAAYGIDPVLFMLAAQVFGIKESELDVAGGLMGRGVELTEAEFVSLPIPANAELVIEGLLHPGDMEDEGPLGEFTGYYGRERAPQPVIEVKAVHHRRSPILTAALMAKYPSCEIGAYYAIMRSARILDDLDRIGVSGVLSAYAHPAAASGWGMVVVSMQQQYAGHAAQVLALTAQCPAAAYYTKWIIAVDEDVDPTDFNDVMWALSTRCNPADDLDILAQHLVDRARSEPVSAGAAAVRIESADQRLQAAQAHQAIPAGDAVAAERVRARGRALGRAWLRGTAAEADGVSQGVSGTHLLCPGHSGSRESGGPEWRRRIFSLCQCSRNSPFSARISAGLISRACATVTECSGPSSFSSQNARNLLSTGNFGQRS